MSAQNLHTCQELQISAAMAKQQRQQQNNKSNDPCQTSVKLPLHTVTLCERFFPNTKSDWELLETPEESFSLERKKTTSRITTQLKEYADA